MNDEEKTQLDILFKNYKGVPFTDKDISYLEENEIVGISGNAMFQNDYIIFESILMDKIPKGKNTVFTFYPPDDGSMGETFSGENYDSYIVSENIKSTFAQIDKKTSIYGYNVEENEMKPTGFCKNVLQYYDENNYPILQKLIHLPLEPVEGTSFQSWYKLSNYSNDSNDNILKYSLPEFPSRWHDDVPIGDVISDDNNIDIHSEVYKHVLYYSAIDTDGKLNLNGQIENNKWNFDLKNGIISFHNEIDSKISENTPPLLTFVKYIGRKNVNLNKLMENSLIFKKQSVNIIHDNGNYVLEKISKVNTEDSSGTILDLSGIGYIKIPFKDTNDNTNNMEKYQDLGAIRYDTVENAFEGYHGSSDGWKSIGGGSGNTSDNSGTEIRISKKDEKEKEDGEFNPDFYTHTIEFYTKEPLTEGGDGKSKRRMIINKNGDIDISNNLKVDGSATIKKDLTVSQDLYAKNIYLDINNNSHTDNSVSVYTLLDNHVKDVSENLWKILDEAPEAFNTLKEVGTFLNDVSDNVLIQINQDIQDISSRSVWSKNGNDIVIEDGNVGIGTTGPGAKLEIEGPQSNGVANTNPFLRLMPNSVINSSGLTSMFLGTSTSANYGISLSAWRKAGVGDPYFAIKTHDNSATGDTRFLLDKNGNVGIGTPSPDSQLTIMDNHTTSEPTKYPIGYSSTEYQPAAALKIFQYFNLNEGDDRDLEGGTNSNPAINIVTHHEGAGVSSAYKHVGGVIQFTHQSMEPGSGPEQSDKRHGQPYASIYGGRKGFFGDYDGEMIFSLTDTNRAGEENLKPRMTINTTGVNVTGDITAFYSSSDKRLKTNINTIENAVEIVQQLRGVRFNWNEEARKINEHVDLEKKEIGVIAQEIEEHLPEIVKKGLSNYKAIRYEKITPVLIEAIKEQQQQINEQKEQIKAQQQQIKAQQQQINEILNRLNNK
jgi:hypothetical protein